MKLALGFGLPLWDYLRVRDTLLDSLREAVPWANQLDSPLHDLRSSIGETVWYSLAISLQQDMRTRHEAGLR